MYVNILSLSFFLTFIVTSNAWAYIGPGVGLSAIGVVIALLAAGILFILGFVWYPVKRLLLKMKKNNAKNKKDNEL